MIPNHWWGGVFTVLSGLIDTTTLWLNTPVLSEAVTHQTQLHSNTIGSNCRNETASSGDTAVDSTHKSTTQSPVWKAQIGEGVFLARSEMNLKKKVGRGDSVLSQIYDPWEVPILGGGYCVVQHRIPPTKSRLASPRIQPVTRETTEMCFGYVMVNLDKTYVIKRVLLGIE